MHITRFFPLFASAAFAGGLMHNTNQSTDFVRNSAQDASISNSVVYYNPAGTVFAEDGVYISAHSQTVWQTREIKTDKFGDYEGKSFVTVMPSLLANWHKGNFALSGGFFIIGGGGEVRFNDGLPMINQLLTQTVSQKMESISAAAKAGDPTAAQMATGVQQLKAQNGISSPSQLFDAKFTGKQNVYAWQLGASYRFMNMFSAYLGARLNYAYNSYEGSMKSTVDNEMLNKMLTKTLLECELTGWGITPIASLGFHYQKWSAGIKYEHNTSIEMKNETKEIDSTAAMAMPQFADGVKSDNDLPAILSVGVSYAWLDWFRSSRFLPACSAPSTESPMTTLAI